MVATQSERDHRAACAGIIPERFKELRRMMVIRAVAQNEDYTMVEGITIESFIGADAADDGEGILTRFTANNGTEYCTFIPAGIIHTLMASLIVAESATYRQQLGRYGSKEAVMNAFGVANFVPSGFQTARGRDESANQDAVLLRLERDGAPVVDVVLGLDSAQQIATALQTEADLGPTPPDCPQSRQ